MNTTDIRDRANEELHSISDRIARAMSRGKFTAAELQEALGQRTKQVARKTDDFVHDYAWSAVGIGVGLGFLAGLLTGRSSSRTDLDDVYDAAENTGRAAYEEAEELDGPSSWDRVQSVLPLALLAFRTYQEWRGGSRFRMRR